MVKNLNTSFLLRICAIVILVILSYIAISKFGKVQIQAQQFSLYSSNVGIGESAPSDTTSPQTTITNPLNGSLVSGGVSYTASASDNVGVTRVEFYVDSGLVGISNSAPYSTNWNTTTYSDALHNLFTKAFDAAGNIGISYSISVTVDNLAPSVSLTNPAGGSTVSGNVNLTSNASDNNSVTKVEYYVDSNFVGMVGVGVTSANFPYNWNSASVTDGNHNIHAKAFDVAGNTASSSAVLVTVDNNAPTVSITSPANGSNVSGIINVTASASDTVGVTSVEFYADGGLITTDTTAPYSTSWDTTIYSHNSSHSLIARAYDGAGHVTTSSVVSVVVSDVTAPSVVITNPQNRGTVAKGSTVTISANASDASAIQYAEFRVNGSLKCTDTTSPYSCNWKVPNRKKVTYTLEAKAFDVAGNTAIHTITVTAI